MTVFYTGGMPEILRKELAMEFDDAVKHVERIATDGGFSTLLIKEMHDIFKMKLGVEDYPKITFILACAADLAKKAVDVSKEMALLMPCSFVVTEEEGKVTVMHTSIMKMGVELGFAPEDGMRPVIEETGRRVHAVWDKL